MAAHRQNSKNKFKPLCQKAFSKVTAQNFEILDEDAFFKILTKQPGYCCKKCANYGTRK